MQGTSHNKLKAFILCLAIFVVGLGAYTRLSDSGLGCPDWPACYGHWYVQKTIHFPHLTYVDTLKAWTEMIHRYIAGCLGLLIILTLGIERFTHTKTTSSQHKTNSFYPILSLLIVQALFGMWTVTWKLHPLAVMPHLIGGMTLTVLISWAFFPKGNLSKPLPKPILQTIWMLFGIICFQVILGGWTSANYAALVCPDFPTCQGYWLPPMAFSEAFQAHPIGPNYDGGLLSGEARTAIHISHRLGGGIAGLLTLYLGFLFSNYRKNIAQSSQKLILALLSCVTIQILLGIANIIFLLPISIAVAHNVVALIILLILTRLMVINYHTQTDFTYPKNTLTT